jgi:integrase
MPRVAIKRFRDEVLALYEPPARARNSWFKARQVLDILEALGVKTTSDLTPGIVSKFVGFNPAWKPETVKGLLGYLSPVCKYAKTMGYVRVNPFDVRKDWYKAPELDDDDDSDDFEGLPEHLPIEELSRLLDHLESGSGTWAGGRLYAMVATFAYTGLRRTEGLTRAVADFDLSRRIVRVKARRRRLKTAASAQPVGLPSELVPILENWLPRSGSKWAFPGVRGKSPWTGGPMGKRPLDELKAAGIACGVGRVNFLMLRHSWATHAELRGIGELMVQRQLRHTSRRTQLHYRHADVVNLAAAVGGFSLRIAKPEPPAAAI